MISPQETPSNPPQPEAPVYRRRWPDGSPRPASEDIPMPPELKATGYVPRFHFNGRIQRSTSLHLFKLGFRFCNHCKTIKAVSEFHRDRIRGGPTGLSQDCKVCRIKKSRAQAKRRAEAEGRVYQPRLKSRRPRGRVESKHDRADVERAARKANEKPKELDPFRKALVAGLEEVRRRMKLQMAWRRALREARQPGATEHPYVILRRILREEG